MTTMNRQIFVYKRKLWTMIYVLIFFSICGITLAHEAKTNQRGLIIDRFFTLSIHEASIFYWCLVVMCAGFVSIAVFMIATHNRQRGFIELLDETIVSPGRKPGSTISTPYDRIQSIQITSTYNQKFAIVRHKSGTLRFPKNQFASNAEFDAFVRALWERSHVNA